MRRKKVVAPLLLILAACVCAFAFFRRMGNSEFWESQISTFEKADRANPPKPGVIVFTGSSSIRFWKTLADDMKPLDVINRGFGGSQISQVNHYATRIILPYRPRAVVLYAGDNDLSWPASKSPEQVFGDFQKFVEIIHGQLPETWIYYISIKPTILRRKNWAKMQKTNELIADYMRTQPRTQFIDVSAAMLDAHGQPCADLFRWDGLHMNASGYAIWTSIIKPVVLSRFGGVD
jgi:lysophospholipase L1-like esterase